MKRTMVDSAMRDQVIQRLLAVSDAKIAASEIHDAMSLREDLDIRSMTLIALAADLEDELGISIDDDVLSRIQTIGDLFAAIENTQSPSGL
ncbi:MAG: acyl carrier protein [Betaproteobacteria bacterium]